MRIAVVNQHRADVVGGSELQCDLVARGLLARGHDVVYVAVTRPGVEAGEPDVPYGLVRVAPEADAIVRACAEADAEVVYWRMNRPALPDVAAGLERHGIPLVFAIADSDDVVRWRRSPWPREVGLRDHLHEARSRVRHRRSWAAFRHVAGIASQRADFVGRVPVREQRVVRNLMTVDETLFGWPRPYVAWVGRLQQRKRPELLPAIADAVAPSGVDVLVAGQVREERYRAIVGPPSVRPNLHHVGVLSQAQVVGLLRGARALAMTAHEEGFANVLLQSWWHGTATVSVAYDPDGLIAAHGLGATGDGDVDAFLARLAEVAALPEASVAARRAHIRDVARQEFASERTLAALEGLLDDVRRDVRR